MVYKILKEEQLYFGMCQWLNVYLNDKYKRKRCKIIVVDCHLENLDKILHQYNVIKFYPQVVGLNIQIDVLGIVIFENDAKIYFIEAKKNSLTLLNLGQLLIYCKLCSPEEAFLLSPVGLGSLNKVLKNLNREDLLDYGCEKKIKKIKVARWSVSRETIDNHSVIPKI